MNLIAVEGGRRLGGELTVQSAKNGVLPVLAAAILCREPCLIRRCPRLSDVDTAVRILRHLGAQARWEGEDLLIDARELTRCDVPEELMRRMRSSVIFLGAILARCGRAEMSYPGGCELGPRPIDLHLSALRALGVDRVEREGGLAAAGETCQHDELVARDGDVDVLEVVLPRALDENMILHILITPQ